MKVTEKTIDKIVHTLNDLYRGHRGTFLKVNEKPLIDENIKNENDFIFISVKDTSTIIYIREIISDTEFCPITIPHDRFSNFNSYMCVLFITIDNFYEYGL